MDAISYKQKEYLYSYFRSKPPELNLHLHKYYEFLYFISGDATYIVEDNLYKIHPGELHTIFFQSEKPYERIFMQIHPDFITEFDLFDKINSSPMGEDNRIPSDIVQSFGLYDYFKNVEHYILNRVPESDAMIKSYFLQFLVAVNHALDNTVLPIKPTNNNRIDDIIDYLTDNIISRSFGSLSHCIQMSQAQQHPHYNQSEAVPTLYFIQYITHIIYF